MDELPDHVDITVPHVMQTLSWDCGLACVSMVLRYLSKDVTDFQTVCKNMNFGESVWTIDLANILRHYQVSHLFCTVTLGVDKGYSNKSFYKAHFNKDEQRVNMLFTEATEREICVEKRSVELEEIVMHLASRMPVIVLVDWSNLFCKWCDRKCLPSISCMGQCLGSYQGHFIVVCGYDKKQNLIFYRNPSYREELCCCSWSVFEKARRSYGTDEDILFIKSDDNTKAKETTSIDHQ